MDARESPPNIDMIFFLGKSKRALLVRRNASGRQSFGAAQSRRPLEAKNSWIPAPASREYCWTPQTSDWHHAGRLTMQPQVGHAERRRLPAYGARGMGCSSSSCLTGLGFGSDSGLGCTGCRWSVGRRSRATRARETERSRPAARGRPFVKQIASKKCASNEPRETRWRCERLRSEKNRPRLARGRNFASWAWPWLVADRDRQRAQPAGARDRAGSLKYFAHFGRAKEI